MCNIVKRTAFFYNTSMPFLTNITIVFNAEKGGGEGGCCLLLVYHVLPRTLRAY